MEKSKTSGLKAATIFLSITFLLSSIVWLVTIYTLGKTGSFANRIYGYGIMWCPALATYITCKILGRNISDLAWRWGKPKYILWSYLTPFLYVLIGYTIVWICGAGGFYNTTFLTKMEHDLGWTNVPSGVFLVIFVILQGVICLIPSISTAVGEEIGWRGFLVPEIAGRTRSYTKTSLIIGLIWAFWHYPLLIFGNYNSGGPSWYSLVTFTIGVVSMSFIATWFRLKSNSLWTGVMLHASHNLFVQGVFDPITINYPSTKYFTGEFGIVVPAIILLFAIYFWTRRKELPPYHDVHI
jgi:membrane protease YdiL (CAAX protease family)